MDHEKTKSWFLAGGDLDEFMTFASKLTENESSAKTMMCILISVSVVVILQSEQKQKQHSQASRIVNKLITSTMLGHSKNDVREKDVHIINKMLRSWTKWKVFSPDKIEKWQNLVNVVGRRLGRSVLMSDIDIYRGCCAVEVLCAKLRLSDVTIHIAFYIFHTLVETNSFQKV